MGINFEYYKVFYYVAKYGNITHAAGHLYLSQSTVTRTIQNLENQLNCKLFLRSRSGVVLTETGTLLYNHVADACESIFLAEQRLAAMNEDNKATLRIGTTELIMDYYLTDLLREFKRKYPMVHIDISFQDPGSVAAALDSGLIDLALLTTPVDPDEKLILRPWLEFNEWLVAGARFQQLSDGEYALRELASFPFVSMRNGMSERIYAERLFAKEELEFVPSCEVGSIHLLTQMVRDGFGLAFLPEILAKDIADGKSVFRIFCKEELPPRKTCAVVKKNAAGNSMAEIFVRFLPL